MDILSGLVEAAKARVSLEQIREFKGVFAEYVAGHLCNIHFVASGQCKLVLEDASQTTLRLQAGDLVVLADKQNHHLSSDAVSDPHGGDVRCRIASGRLQSHEKGSEAIYECLPPILVINLFSSTATRELNAAIHVGAALDEEVGGRSILSRMAELLILMQANRYLKSTPERVPGWAGIFSDPKIGKALRAVHGEPGAAWTVDRLAREAGMSRTAFSVQFREKIGEPPMAYVLRWRLQIAIDLLRAESRPLAEVAHVAGYATEAAFSKAFRREIGVSPTTYRRAMVLSDCDASQRDAANLRGKFAPIDNAPHDPLNAELNKIALETERLIPPAMCSILLLDQLAQKLHLGAAPSLPDAYNRIIDGISVGPQAGSCGTAVYLKRPVVTRDISSSELWADYRYLAERFNLRSCWSSPIFDDNGAILGTIAIYYADFHEPNGAELGLVDHMSHRVKTTLLARPRNGRYPAATTSGH